MVKILFCVASAKALWNFKSHSKNFVNSISSSIFSQILFRCSMSLSVLLCTAFRIVMYSNSSLVSNISSIVVLYFPAIILSDSVNFSSSYNVTYAPRLGLTSMSPFSFKVAKTCLTIFLLILYCSDNFLSEGSFSPSTYVSFVIFCSRSFNNLRNNDVVLMQSPLVFRKHFQTHKNLYLITLSRILIILLILVIIISL